jgi:hypothetical protein
MTRTRIAAAALLTLGLLAPVAVASSASAAAPGACGQSVQVKDHKINKANAHAKDAKAKGKKKGHSKPAFVHGGKVTAVDTTASTLTFVVHGGQNKALRGCALTVVVTADTKITRNDAVATLATIAAGDHVNVKGTSALSATTGLVTFTATRVSAEAPGFDSAG